MIPKTMKKNSKNTRVLPSSGSDLSIMDTSLRMLGTLLTDLKGLNTLKDRRTLNDGNSSSIYPTDIMISSALVRTTKKSNLFQPSFR